MRTNSSKSSILYFTAAVIVSLFLTACATLPKTPPSLSPEQLYLKGIYAIEKGKPREALTWFERTEQEYPYSNWATEAQLMQLFCHYSLTDYVTTIAQSDNFILNHPINPHLDYVYYLKAVSYYDQIMPVTQDQTNTKEALAALQTVVTIFPGTAYAKDAQVKIDLAHDHLAAQEMSIGRFYQHRGHLPAALRRYSQVIENYDTTPQIAEALFRMVEIFYHMGLHTDAERYAAILGYNYPNSNWYKLSYNLLKTTLYDENPY